MNKKTQVLKSFNIEANELGPVLLLMVQSVFIGIFYGAFDISAHTLFLRTFPEDMIGKAYMVSGIVGIILTASFSKLQSKIKFSRLAQFSLLFIALSTVALRAAFEFVNTEWVIMTVFVLFGPLSIIGLLSFWGTAGRMFSLRQGKRLFGIIDAGQIFGIILSSYMIPLVLVYLKGTNNLLIICAISAVFAMLVEIVITHKYKIDKTEESTPSKSDKNIKQEEQVKLKDFVKKPYLLYMALFVAFSMFAAFFMQYSFMVVIKENYPVEEDLAKFLGFFTGTMMVFILIIKTFVYGKLLKTYGLKISLLLSSLLLVLFTGIAIASGLIAGYEINTPGFLYFFLFIALGKLFNKTLKDSLEVPSFKLLYQSLSKNIRFDIQAKIDGTVNEIAALTSGVLLSILGILAFVKLIHFSVVLFVILVIWAFITIKLYKEYKKSLELALNKGDGGTIESDNNYHDIFQGKTDEQKKKSIRKIQQVLPFQYPSLLNQFIIDNPTLEYSYDTLIDAYILEIDRELVLNIIKKSGVDANNNASALTLKEIAYNFSKDDLHSSIKTINYISSLTQKNRFTILSALLRTPSLKTQKIAIKLCAYFKEIDTIPTLVEFVSSENLMTDAVLSIDSLSKIAYKQLIQVYYRTDITLKAQLVIIQVLSKVNENEVHTFLLDNLFLNQTEIVSKSIESLIELKYQVSEEFLPRLFEPINRVAGYLAWDIATLASLDNDNVKSNLYDSVLQDYQLHQKFLFNFLKICYDKQSVETVEEYIASDDSENVGYGLELFDMLLSEEIKPVLLLLFDEISMEDKARLLENHFAIETTTTDRVIIKIINRDPNLISKRTKKLALNHYTEYYTEIISDISSQLFSPVEDLQLLAANTMLKIDQSQYNGILQRVDIKQRKKLESNLIKEELSGISLTQADEIIQKFILSKTLQSNSMNQIADEFSYELIISDKNINLKEQVNNYFVFLIIDPTLPMEEHLDFEPNFNFSFNSTADAINKKKLIIGIKQTILDDLVIKNRSLVQNLLKLS